MVENNDDLGFCFPKEGVNEFYDAFCIPSCSQNKKGAEAFINFMHEPEVAFENEEYIYYASANTTVAENNFNILIGLITAFSLTVFGGVFNKHFYRWCQ